ncbi:hypothetical protein M0813_21611 [Anaeramoeba flamelloides]|uniref:Uncharacterized protein n=1 Tax=Anaeramoeba flamelloides TaxID=1746091 RepID=A0ABQ8YGZ1_9EUKA|nr:hypothetical protein M0813_21611 [Anaeramoeba flamelloides]
MENRKVHTRTNFGIDRNLLNERKRKDDGIGVVDYMNRRRDHVAKKLRTNATNEQVVMNKRKKKQSYFPKNKKVEKINQSCKLSHLKMNSKKKVNYQKKKNSTKSFKLQKPEPPQIEFNVCGIFNENKIVQKLEQKIVNQKIKQDLLVDSMDFLQTQKRDLKYELKKLKQLYKLTYNKEYVAEMTKDKKGTTNFNSDSIRIPKIQIGSTRKSLATTLKHDQLTIVKSQNEPFQQEQFIFKEENRISQKIDFDSFVVKLRILIKIGCHILYLKKGIGSTRANNTKIKSLKRIQKQIKYEILLGKNQLKDKFNLNSLDNFVNISNDHISNQFLNVKIKGEKVPFNEDLNARKLHPMKISQNPNHKNEKQSYDAEVLDNLIEVFQTDNDVTNLQF